MRTSLSDKASYRTACEHAAHDDKAFETFRHNPGYTEILEHVSGVDGQKYLALIEELGAPRGWVDACHENDMFGEPELTTYPGVGSVSPTTLRYMYQMCKLRRLFGDLNMSIVEIGGGYGGLCRLIKKFYPAAKYSMIDLPEARALQDAYLRCFDVQLYPYEPAGYNLAISNYAFSECDINVQREYLDHVLKRSQRGYITGNFEAMDTGFPRYSIQQLMLHIPKSVRIPHVPSMGPGLWVWMWGLGL